MKSRLILFLASITFFFSSCAENKSTDLVRVQGGNFINSKSNYFGEDISVPDFYIGIKEVSQKEWAEVMGDNPSKFKGDNLPVEMVSWYDCIEYCNKRSIKEGFDPYYILNKSSKDPTNDNEFDTVKWTVSINKKANGYRLPTIMEWEYASSGGQLSKNYSYSGSNNLEDVGWYWCNSGDKNLKDRSWNWEMIQSNNCKTRPVGSKLSNELGLYDMSGNVREWCFDWKSKGVEVAGRAWKGGCWFSGDFSCESSFTEYYTPDVRSMDQGFRVCRNF